jgi:hypothetical protein
MGVVIEISDNNGERQRLRKTIEDLKIIIAIVVKPDVRATLQAHLEHYTERLEMLDQPKLKAKIAGALVEGCCR